MSANITIDDSEWTDFVSEIEDKFENIGDMLTQFAENHVVPVLQSSAGSERQVRTGTYMNDWEAEQEDESTCAISTDAFYWKFLEYGTSKGIEPKPIIPDAIEAIKNDFAEFFEEALDL